LRQGSQKCIENGIALMHQNVINKFDSPRARKGRPKIMDDSCINFQIVISTHHNSKTAGFGNIEQGKPKYFLTYA